jgi:hypothetical protein
MYMSGKLAVDPSQMANVRRKPSKGFRRFAEILTAGMIAEHEVHQTFSALSILQEVNCVLRSLGITDVVRFTKDDTVVYEDSDSEDTDDMQVVLDRLSQESRSISGSVFESMSLLLEHHLPNITLVIEVRIQRTHAVGHQPIQILVNGLASSFSQDEKDAAAEKLSRSFEDQLGYNAFADDFRNQFDEFMSAATCKRKKCGERQKLRLSARKKMLARRRRLRPVAIQQILPHAVPILSSSVSTPHRTHLHIVGFGQHL